MNCVVIGYGNVAQALIRNFDITACYLRELSKVDNSDSMRCTFVDSYMDLPKADLYIIAVNDDSVENVLKNMKDTVSQDSVIAHTSGAVSLDIIKSYFRNPAVIYPLYPFAEGVDIDFDKITILAESLNSHSKMVVDNFLSQKKGSIQWVNSEQRAKIHVSAVFSCNFVNHLIALSQQYLEQCGYGINLLEPLIKQTFSNILENNGQIFDTQTGPAIREDYTVIEKHIEILGTNPKMLELYKRFTNSIIEMKNDYKKL